MVMLDFLLALGMALAAPKIRDETVLAWLRLGIDAIRQTTESDRLLRELSEQIRQMVAEERDPTPEEWMQLRNRSDSAHDRIQNA